MVAQAYPLGLTSLDPGARIRGKGLEPHIHKTMNFSSERFVDIGQTLYTQWSSQATNMGSVTDEECREAFKILAELAFMAAEEFAKVFDGQEN